MPASPAALLAVAVRVSLSRALSPGASALAVCALACVAGDDPLAIAVRDAAMEAAPADPRPATMAAAVRWLQDEGERLTVAGDADLGAAVAGAAEDLGM